MTLFEQRLRDARTIFDAHWRRTTDKPELSDDVKEIIAAAMIDYAIQCELKNMANVLKGTFPS